MSERSQSEQAEAEKESVEISKQENLSTNNIIENENTDEAEPIYLHNYIARALLKKAHKKCPLISLGKQNI